MIKKGGNMFVILSIIFVICAIIISIISTTEYADNFVRIIYNHILLPLFRYNFINS